MAGQALLGILLLDTSFPRIPGDVGNVESYDFPVMLKIVHGATVQRIVFEADAHLLDSFVQAARQLEMEGATAITSSCGFLATFQEAVARAVHVPVFLSSLLQVPLVYAMTGRRVAILTAHSERLTEQVLVGAGISPRIPLFVAGLQDVTAFSDPILKDGDSLHAEAIEQEILEKAHQLLDSHPDIGAFVFECHNLAPYGQAVQRATSRPVFDILDFARWVYAAVEKRCYPASPTIPQS